MREHRDLVVLASLFVGGLTVTILFFWITGNAAEEHRSSQLRSAVTALSGGDMVGEAWEVEEPPVHRIYPLESEEGGYLVELSVMGYRGQLRFMVRLAGAGRVEGFHLLSDREDPAYDWFLRDPELLRNALNRSRPVEAVAGATVTVRALSEAVDEARDTLEGR